MGIDLNRPGRMISGNKTAPKGHVCVFNGNLCTKSAGKIWFGDIDLTTDHADLQRIADELGEDVHILRENDARFEHEHAPRFDRAVAVISPTRTRSVGEGLDSPSRQHYKRQEP